MQYNNVLVTTSPDNKLAVKIHIGFSVTVSMPWIYDSSFDEFNALYIFDTSIRVDEMLDDVLFSFCGRLIDKY